MFKYIWLVFPAVVFILMMSVLVWTARQADQRTIRIDCSIAEISPDIPVEAKELCRRYRSGRI